MIQTSTSYNSETKATCALEIDKSNNTGTEDELWNVGEEEINLEFLYTYNNNHLKQ